MLASRAAGDRRPRGVGLGRALVLLGALAVPAAAQQLRGGSPLASNVAQVQLVVVVPPRATFTPSGAIRELDRTPAARLLAAPLGVSVNVPHRIRIQRMPDPCRGADGDARRVAVRMPDGAFAELTERPLTISRGADMRGVDTRGAETRGADSRGADSRRPGPAAAASEVLLYQVSTAAATCDVPLPVRYEIEVTPTL